MPNWVLICLGSGIVFALGFYFGLFLMALMAAAGGADQATERRNNGR